jgi:hypothetical protein
MPAGEGCRGKILAHRVYDCSIAAVIVLICVALLNVAGIVAGQPLDARAESSRRASRNHENRLRQLCSPFNIQLHRHGFSGAGT